MNRQLETRFDALLRALPTLGPGVELILRPTDTGATATLRTDGAPPRVFRAEGDEVAETFATADQGLPGAALLADPSQLQQALAACIGSIAAAQLVAWRPARRAVARVIASDGSVHWLKLLDRKSWRRAAAAFAAVGAPLHPTQLALPELLLPDACAYLVPNVPGSSLRTLAASDAWPTMTTLVRGLMSLGYTDLRAELPRHDFERARTTAINSLEQGAALRPELADLPAAIAGMAAPAAPTHLGFVHGDLHDKQLFVDGERMTVIDLEGMAFGDIRFDLANLAEHVRLRELQRSGQDSGRADHLLTRCGHGPDDVSMRAFRTVVRARLCGVYALRPRWQPLVASLLAEVRELVGRIR